MKSILWITGIISGLIMIGGRVYAIWGDWMLGIQISLINQCKSKGIMFRFRAIYDFDTDTPTTGMVAIDPKMIISVCEEPKAVER